MHELLAGMGIDRRSRNGAKESIIQKFEEGMGTKPAANERFAYRSLGWPVMHRPIDALQAWHHKSGLAGIEIDIKTKDRVLDQLTEWARHRYGDL